MSDRLAVFAGSRSAFNVLHDVTNIGWMLYEDFDLDLVVNSVEYDDDRTDEFFDVHRYEYASNDLGEAKALDSYLRNQNPSMVINVVEPPIHATLVSTIAKYRGTPFVYRYSSDLFDLYRVTDGWRKVAHFGLNNVLGRLPLALADRCIALGPTGKRRLVSRGMDPSNVGILPPPIDGDRFAEPPDEPDWDLPSDRSVALFAGRRTPIKGIHDMEAAIPNILERRDDIQFVFVGSHGKTPRVPGRYADHVTMVGRVPLGGMPAYFHAADVLVLPTYNEGLPRVVTESLASGTPVVARDVADIAYATENTFDRLEEFVEMVVDFESLPLDDATPFTRQSLKSDYVEFFSEI